MGLFDKLLEKTRQRMIAEANAAPDKSKSAAGKKSSQGQNRQEGAGGPKILLVNSVSDDVGDFLQSYGYTVYDETDYITDALDALEMLLQKEAQLVLIDATHMEDEMLEYVDLLHDMKPEIPILLRFVPWDLEEAALNSGASIVLGSDHSSDDILDAVSKLIG